MKLKREYCQKIKDACSSFFHLPEYYAMFARKIFFSQIWGNASPCPFLLCLWLLIIDYSTISTLNVMGRLNNRYISNPAVNAPNHNKPLIDWLIDWLSSTLFYDPLFRTTRVSRYQKGKTNLDLLEQETVSGSGISWAICKSAPHPRHTPTPAPNQSVRMPFCCSASSVKVIH